MIVKELMIQNPTGLHARPATEFVAEAKKHQSNIQIFRPNEPDLSVNAKSIVGLLSLGLYQGESFCITAAGPDEAAAIDGLTALVESGFGEL